MKNNSYLNFILTVIAINLTVMVLQNAEILPHVFAENTQASPSYSNTNPLPVKIVDIDTYDQLKVDIAKVSTNDDLDINIADVSTYDKLRVDIEESIDLNVKVK